MPNYGFSIVPLDPFVKPDRSLLGAVEKRIKADFSPLYTNIQVFDTPQLIIAPENEVCMTCPKCGIIDKDYKWLDVLPLSYRSDNFDTDHLNFDCQMQCCKQSANIFDLDFRYSKKELELGAGFTCAQVSVTEANTRRLNSDDLLEYAQLMECPVRPILMMS